MSNVPVTVESQYMTSYLTALLMFFLSVTFLRFSLVKYVWLWPWPLAKVKYNYPNQKTIYDLLFDGNSNFTLSTFSNYSLSKCVWPWPLPLEWVKVKCKYTNKKPIHDLLFDGNSNFCPMCHQDIHCPNVHDLYLDL